MVSIATPADKVAKGANYTTLDGDWVIKGIPNSYQVMQVVQDIHL